MRHSQAPPEFVEMAALYSGGALEPQRVAEFEQHLASGCEACTQEWIAFQETAVELAFSLPAIEPPPSLRARVLQAAAATSRVTVRAAETGWKSIGLPGVLVRHLFRDQATRLMSSLLKVEPGAVYPAHHHHGLEHCYVIDGDVVFDDHTLDTGDYEVALSSSEHSSVTTREGCTLLLIHNINDKILA